MTESHGPYSPLGPPYSQPLCSGKTSLPTRNRLLASALRRRRPLSYGQASMPEPGPTVTLLPISHILYQTNPERCSFKRSAQGQGSAPRRSVSSMTRLLPLILSPTASSLSTLPVTSFPVTKMATIYEPAMECNFPELLARDLEVSEAVFTSKSMTAGCPSSGLATSSV
jgi:hypothetical protein